MLQGQSDPNNMTQNELIIWFSVMQRELELKDAVIFQRDQELAKVNSELMRQKSELEKSEDTLDKRNTEISELKTQFEVTKVKLTQAESELGKKRSVLKPVLLAVVISALFGATIILFNLGNSMITATPPNSQGNTLLVIAFIVYLLASLINVIIVGGGKS